MIPMWQLSIVAVGFHIFRTLEVNRLMGKLLQQPDTYADFEFLAFWQTQYNNMNAVNVFFAWIKVPGNCLSPLPQCSHLPSSTRVLFSLSDLVPPGASINPGAECSVFFTVSLSLVSPRPLQIFKYISFNKTMTQLSSTLARCAKDILGFAVMFFIVFFAYAQLGYLIFGTQVENFSTFVKCMCVPCPHPWAPHSPAPRVCATLGKRGICMGVSMLKVSECLLKFRFVLK